MTTHDRARASLLPLALLGSLGCSPDGIVLTNDDEVGEATSGSGADDPASESDTATIGEGDTSDPDEGPRFDTLTIPDGISPAPPPAECSAAGDLELIGVCERQAPTDSFEPYIQWTFTDPIDRHSNVIPLVANLTDDNGDDAIDLCDIPDVVLVAAPQSLYPMGEGHIYVLSGDTGALHFRIDVDIDPGFTPALGDIDGDGFVEIVTKAYQQGVMLAFSHTGELEWTTTLPLNYEDGHPPDAAALGDLDNDGDVEIVVANLIYDHEGTLVQTLSEKASHYSATTLADLDGDDDLEVVIGHAAFHHDGAPLWITGLARGLPQVADLDDDGLPEVLLASEDGLALIEHDGALVWYGFGPEQPPFTVTEWRRPVVIHDFDGDGQPEFGHASRTLFQVYEIDGTVRYWGSVADHSGAAGAGAFDFFGDGVALAAYADEEKLFVFGSAGELLLHTNRDSSTLIEYPVIADVDNDGSAEMLVVASKNDEAHPTLVVMRDTEDRWVATRRIWNQHTYHVTNVREDGSIPQFEPRSWEGLNTFRANPQIEFGEVCVPDVPEG